jgi:uncharacterized membrane protein YozB (DUF420 family)
MRSNGSKHRFIAAFLVPYVTGSGLACSAALDTSGPARFIYFWWYFEAL